MGSGSHLPKQAAGASPQLEPVMVWSMCPYVHRQLHRFPVAGAFDHFVRMHRTFAVEKTAAVLIQPFAAIEGSP